MMRVFHRLYLVCACGAGISMLLSAICYVKLDIRTAWRVLAGAGRSVPEKRKKKSVKRKRTEEVREQDTVLLREKKTVFRVEREIMRIHTGEEIG